MSKSGLFAHFGSREELLLAVLDRGQQEFIKLVVNPALAKPRGLPRLKALFVEWLGWTESADLPGGCTAATSRLGTGVASARLFATLLPISITP
jgi:AcrR family transcriptional regulator